MPEMIDIAPSVHMLQSMRADRGSYLILAGEAIDNSLDAGASSVTLVIARGLIRIEDDGAGISRDRATAIARFGEHGPMSTTQLGRFGIGIKYQAVNAGDVMDVVSVSRDGRMKLRVDWAAMQRRGAWNIPAPIWTPVRHGTQTGTTVEISALRWPSPADADLAKLAAGLAQIFYPAIAVSRRALSLNGVALPVLTDPALTSVVDDTILFESGKGARVHGGLLTDTTGPLYQVHIGFRHRVIMPRSTFGCGEYTGTRRMFARVELTGPWGFDRFKDSIRDQEYDALEEAVHAVLRPILEQCDSAKMSADVAEMTAMVNDLLPSDMVAARPHRDKTGQMSRGGSRKSAQHRKANRASEAPAGPARTPRKRPRLLIEFTEPLVDDHGYGLFEAGKPERVKLARDNPHIAELLKYRDKELGARTLYALALMIYHHAQEMSPPTKQGELQFDGSFGLRVWLMTAHQRMDIDGGSFGADAARAGGAPDGA